ncbi:MAG: type II toxin-antitoxin system prevent-host-death family antitoxin [Mycobacterium sp.]|uniref:type II toxin-antitoxin system Phd/YefM family antitoxin n=1 Tax=Mycobacterium sp. TaxID=1785 RepID=UPI003BB6263C
MAVRDHLGGYGIDGVSTRLVTATNTPVSQRELRNDSGAIMRRVQQGERFTVTRNGVRVADLIPHSESGPDRPPRFIPVARRRR